MKKLITVIAAGSAMIALGTSGAQAATATATATAEILEQVTITQVSDLDFGTIVPDATNLETVTVAANAAGTRNCGILTCAGTVSSASFDVTGANGLNVDITGLGALTQLTSGGNNMPISLNGSAAVLAMTGAAVALYVGGDLDVAANQPAGVYSGSFDVTAEYQ